MLEYKIADLVLLLSALEVVRRDAVHADRGQSSEMPPQKWKDSLGEILDKGIALCSSIDIDTSLVSAMTRLRDSLKDGTADCRPTVMHARIDAIISGIQENLNSRMFMYIPSRDAHYWGNPELFGKDFLAVFPHDAVIEMMEAGNCFAVSRGIACVFHSMRVAEHGLRRLARRVGVKLIDRGKPMAIEYATWDKVIQGIRNEIADVRKLPLGKSKEAKLKFYSDAADHCEYMKDIWRNEISHTRRRSYNREETLGVFNRVRDFVQLLAKHEIPKNRKQPFEKLSKRIQQLQSSHDGTIEGSAQRDKGSSGRREGTEEVRSPEKEQS